MNIVLIGYRGTGKSDVGRRLARNLGAKLVSIDEEIVKTYIESVERQELYLKDCHKMKLEEIQ